MQRRLTTSEKLKEAFRRAPRRENISKLLNISRPTLNRKLKDNDWSLGEIVILKDANIIK